MESHQSPQNPTPDGARAALDALNADRSALADRIVTPPWFYPGIAAVTTAFVASPAAPSPLIQCVVVALGSVALISLVLAYKRVTGLAISRTAGPRSLALLIVLGALVVLLLITSLALSLMDREPWVAATAAFTFVMMWAGCLAYDRAYDAELRRGA
ncbi:hypothetical protein [Nocardiopsis sp. MG754419]|uniref:hypothetical protein n=1 Tax=Nocardiopsis sp. MG754419 TaxID=2259865 RepID=UPI001BADA625|nr:hypothetical protein [Nocardiopsis sp. MG754419]MBR8740853.1 hypothetical protein [Nocardiopsis sp. MG754419]